MSLLLATQITAVATAVLAFFAIVTACFAYLAWRSQSREVRLLRRSRRIETRDGRWAQARRVYMTQSLFPGVTDSGGDGFVVGRIRRPPAITATMHNTGDRPVYDVRIHWVETQHIYPDGSGGSGRNRRPAG